MWTRRGTKYALYFFTSLDRFVLNLPQIIHDCVNPQEFNFIAFVVVVLVVLLIHFGSTNRIYSPSVLFDQNAIDIYKPVYFDVINQSGIMHI